MDKRDRDKTAFTSNPGRYWFTKMRFELKNAPATFQRVMDVIPAFILWHFDLVYLYDIVVISKSPVNHIEQIRHMLRVLYKAGTKLKLNKCKFFVETIDYLSHIVRFSRIELAERTMDAITKLKNPTTQMEPNFFLGLCNAFSRFLPSFVRLTAPLDKTLRKYQPQTFGPFDEKEKPNDASLARVLISPSVLALLKSTGQYTLDTDAGDKQIGCVLFQAKDYGGSHPVDHWSRTLNNKQQKLVTTHRECLAAVWAVTLFRPYLKGNRYMIRTDREALCWTLTLADATRTLARCRWRLS